VKTLLYTQENIQVKSFAHNVSQDQL